MRIALGLLRRLMRSNVRSMQIAKDLMLAQDLADLHFSNVGPAIDAAAVSGGDQDAIDRAIDAVAAAELADAEEFALSREWGAHCGAVLMRARTSVEEHPKTGRRSIVATEIPYQINKAKLIEKIAELVREKRIEGIAQCLHSAGRLGPARWTAVRCECFR